MNTLLFYVIKLLKPRDIYVVRFWKIKFRDKSLSRAVTFSCISIFTTLTTKGKSVAASRQRFRDGGKSRGARERTRFIPYAVNEGRSGSDRRRWSRNPLLASCVQRGKIRRDETRQDEARAAAEWPPAVKNRTNLQREASILFVAAVLFRQGRRGEESTRIPWSLSPGTPEVKNRKGALRARLKRSSVRLSSRDKWCDSTTEMREGKSSMVRGRSYSSNTGGRSEDGPVNESDGLHAAIHWHSSTKGQVAHCTAETGTHNLCRLHFRSTERRYDLTQIRVFSIERSSTECARREASYISLSSQFVSFQIIHSSKQRICENFSKMIYVRFAFLYIKCTFITKFNRFIYNNNLITININTIII